MNLARLMDRGVSPPVIADALIARFDVEQWEITAGGWPFQYAFLCTEQGGDRLRLMVLFAWLSTGWHYQACNPKHLAGRLRLCAGQ